MNILSQWKIGWIIGYLKNTTPQKLSKMSERLLLQAFHRAAESVPAYKEILQNAGVNPDEIKTIQQFRKNVPLLDKDSTVTRYEIDKLCVNGNLDDVVSLGSSSGTSGIFSYSVLTKKDIEATFEAHDLIATYFLNADKRKTLLINCLSMGQRVYSNLLVTADTCVYTESAVAIIKKFGRKYEQILITGNQVFIKNLIEEGYTQGIDWPSLLVHVITGGEWTSESWRAYIAHLLHIDLDRPETGIILFSGGIAELFLHTVFHETIETIKIQRLIYKDPRLRLALLGKEADILGQLFIYYPNRTYLEVIPSDSELGELVFSNVGPDAKTPLLRYRTYDVGKKLTYENLREALDKAGYAGVPLPELKLPLLIIYGRKNNFMVNGQAVTPEAVKEALYLDFGVADAVTGNFKMRNLNSSLRIDIQLKPQRVAQDDLLRSLEQNIAKYVKMPFDLKLYKYEDFPDGMRLDYERKFSYVG